MSKISSDFIKQTFSNLCSLLKCYEIAKDQADDLIFFVEDDYLHFEPMMEEMIASYERISSQLKIFIQIILALIGIIIIYLKNHLSAFHTYLRTLTQMDLKNI